MDFCTLPVIIILSCQVSLESQYCIHEEVEVAHSEVGAPSASAGAASASVASACAGADTGVAGFKSIERLIVSSTITCQEPSGVVHSPSTPS